MEEYFLITWNESGDEIHFLLLPMSEYTYVSNSLQMFFDRSGKYSWDFLGGILESIRQKTVKDMWIQTYCTEDWPFGEYNIKKIISLPDFGC